MSTAHAALPLAPPHPSTLPPLGRKQRSEHGDWLRTWDAIRAHPDRARATRLIDEAADRVRLRCSNSTHPSFGWSGGKDSLALQVVAETAGVTDSVLVISGLEWPAFLNWATANMPWGLTVEIRDHLDLPWLAAHPEMLFPAQPQAHKWFVEVQHTGQRLYVARTGVDLLLLGRRTADGNYCGHVSPAGGHEYADPNHRAGHPFVRYSPISDWSHEDVLHVLASRDVELPPCYSWPRGFRVGTGPWPARQWVTNRRIGWQEVLSIDPSVVDVAARAGIPGAREVRT